MKLFEIILPVLDNSGEDLSAAHDAFVSYLLDKFGGFTSLDTKGAWKDDKGRVFRDASVTYRVASTTSLWGLGAVAKARELFPDQLAFYVAEVGTGEIIEVVLEDAP